MTSSATPHFAAAAKRHVEDGVHLHLGGRSVTADHLAGLGAECALKAMLVDFLGAGLTSKGIPQIGGEVYNKHIDGLWAQLTSGATGRVQASFVGMLGSPSPFGDWRIEERYADGSQCTATRTAARLTTAQSLLARHQQARVLGQLL